MQNNKLKSNILFEATQEYFAYKTPNDVVANFSKQFTETEKSILNLYKGTILISGGMIGFDRGLSDYLNMMYEENHNLFLLSEVTAENRIKTDDKIKMPHICVPHLFAKEMVILDMDIPYTDEMVQYCENEKTLDNALRNLLGRYQGRMTFGYAVNFVWYAYIYVENLLSILKPKKVMLWNQFYAFHMIFESVCKKRRIPVAFMEFGVIPGTLSINETGQMGESPAAINYISYRYKYVNKNDISQGYKVIKYIRDNRIDRNPQPEDVEEYLKIIDQKRQVFLYLGHNDYEAGTYPYNDRAGKYHSPVFKTSDDTAKYIWKICKEHNWGFIYKPHPLVLAVGRSYDSQDFNGMTIARNCNIISLIRSANVCMTILSQSAYTALINEKPVVMLGYNQLRGKGCTYEAFSEKRIIKCMELALEKGMTIRQKKNFTRHIAVMLKYCLYDDMTLRAIRYGRRLTDGALNE